MRCGRWRRSTRSDRALRTGDGSGGEWWLEDVASRRLVVARRGCFVAPRQEALGPDHAMVRGRKGSALLAPWPGSWIENRERLDLTVPFNLVTTNDIIGGNSGSPMINRDGQIVGLAFGFDEALNRTVAVDSRAIKETLKKIYKAERLLAELP